MSPADALWSIFEAAIEALLQTHPPAELRTAIDRTAAKVMREAAEAALAAKFPNE